MMKRNIFLDGFCGLFALGIMLSHCFFLRDYTQSAQAFNSYISRFANVGFFFMVSGFFIVQTYKQKQTLVAFLKNKLKKLYPLHLLLLLFLIARGILRGTMPLTTFNIVSAVASLFLVQTWIPNPLIANSMNGVSWFLSSLMFCYMVGYYIAGFLNKKQKAWSAIYILTVLLLIYKLAVAIALPTDNTGIGYYLAYLCPLSGSGDFLIGICIGKVVSVVQENGEYRIPYGVFQITSIILIVLMFVTKRYLSVNFSRAFYSIPFNAFLIFSFSTETKEAQSDYKLSCRKCRYFQSDIR